MAERKYRYKRPDGLNENVEAIFEELTLSPSKNRISDVGTLKDHVRAIFDEVRSAQSERREEKKQTEINAEAAVCFIGLFSLFCFFLNLSRKTDGDLLDQYHFAIRLCGVILATIFVGITIERTPLFRRTWSFRFTKIVAGVAFSAMLVFCTGKASSMINGVFSVDASAVPLTRAIVTGILIFQYSYPLMVIVAIFAVMHLLSTANWIHHTLLKKDRYDGIPWTSWLFLILSTAILLFCYRWINTDFSDEHWPKKIYRLAHVLDFNSRYSCVNVRKDLSVIFIGPQQDKVLVDLHRPQTDDLESFVNGEMSENVVLPKEFFLLPCKL